MENLFPLIQVLKDASLSPRAMAGYIAVIAAWALRAWLVSHPRNEAKKIISQYRDDEARNIALRELLGNSPPPGLKESEILQWSELQLRVRTRTMLAFAYAITLLAVIIIIYGAFDLYKKNDAPPKLIDTKVERPQ